MTGETLGDVSRGKTDGVRVRVAALVFSGDDVLVVEHSAGGNRWKCFPGGGLEFGESLEDCVKRELDEELGMTCSIGPLVAVGYFLDEHTHTIEFFLQCSGTASVLQPSGESVTGAWWVDRRRLHDLSVFPLELSAELATLSADTVSNVRYLGRFG